MKNFKSSAKEPKIWVLASRTSVSNNFLYAIILDYMPNISQDNDQLKDLLTLRELRKQHQRKSTVIAAVIGCLAGMLISGFTSIWTVLVGLTAIGGIYMLSTKVRVSWILPKKNSQKLSVSLYEERSAVLVRILSVHGILGFEDLKDQSQFLDRALVPTLQRMIQNGLVEEELHMDSGQWKYKLSSEFDRISTNQSIGDDINQRMKKLERKDQS